MLQFSNITDENESLNYYYKRKVLEAMTANSERTDNITTNISVVMYSLDSVEVDFFDPIFIFMCLVYTISTLSAIITNLIVILLYFLSDKPRTDISIYLVNLGIADFVMSTVCMPFTFAQVLLKRWIFGRLMCPIVLFQQFLTVSLSIYTLVAIGIDRYFAIKNPLKIRVTHQRGKFVIALIWFISLSFSAVQLFVGRVQRDSYITYLNGSQMEVVTYTCNENWSSVEAQQIYTLFNLFVIYLIPVLILG
jgi:hypothetical protein